MGDERFHEALRRLLEVAAARARRRDGDEVPLAPEEREAEDALMTQVAAIVEAHGQRQPPPPQRPEPAVVRLAEALCDLLAVRPEAGALADGARRAFEEGGIAVSSGELDSLLGDLTPGAVASVGGPPEAALRMVVRVLRGRDETPLATETLRAALHSHPTAVATGVRQASAEELLRFVQETLLR